MKLNQTIKHSVLLILILSIAGCTNTYKNNAKLYQTVRQGSVEVLINGTLQGTGVFVDPSGLILTAEHAVHDPACKVEILTKDKRRFKAEVIAIDRNCDLALLQVPKADNPYFTLPLADKLPTVDKAVYVYGTPIFRHDIMLKGSIASDTTAFEWLAGVDRYQQIVYYSGMAPGGVSGGPWVNDKGQLIGLQSGGMTSNNALVGIAFVAPLEAIKKIIQTRKSASTPSLRIAVNELWERGPDYFAKFPTGTTGLAIAIIKPDSPLADTECKQEDVIIAVDGQHLQYRDQLLKAIQAKNVDDNVELTLLHPDNQQSYKVSVKLKRLEDNASQKK
ncbi:MAG: serine protease [Phycisphaerae bacterium]|nr:serine protease [Phycisphaerae bacterium]